jgi:hypothetical protein
MFSTPWFDPSSGSAHSAASPTGALPAMADRKPADPSDDELRRSCQAMLDSLPFPKPWSWEAFLDALAAVRGRPIHVITVDLGPQLPCGFVGSTAEWDVIVQPPTPSATLVHLVRLHELAHLLAADEQTATERRAAQLDTLRRLLPDLPMTMLRRLLGRGGYTSVAERRAELFATMFLTRVIAMGHCAIGDRRGRSCTELAVAFDRFPVGVTR